MSRRICTVEQKVPDLVGIDVCPSVAPLCFLYNEPSKLYSVFRMMYIRYFFRLHSISSSPSVSSSTLNSEKTPAELSKFGGADVSPAGHCGFVSAVRAAAAGSPAAALLPPPTDRGTAVS